MTEQHVELRLPTRDCGEYGKGFRIGRYKGKLWLPLSKIEITIIGERTIVKVPQWLYKTKSWELRELFTPMDSNGNRQKQDGYDLII